MVLIVLLLLFWVWVLHKMGAPRMYGYSMVGAVLVGVAIVHLALPAGHQVRLALGGTLRPWIVLVAVGVLVAVYRYAINLIRTKSAPEEEREKPLGAPFSEVELERYARHIVLREIGGVGQQRLKKAKVLVVGAGGLGAPALLYLAAAGVGRLGIIDADEVSLSNLQRQVLFTEDDLQQAKPIAAARRLEALNPHPEYRPYNRKLDAEIAQDLIGEYDLVLDGTDDFATRALVNRTCVALKVPLISGAISQWEGQITVVDTAKETACMNCLFPKEPAPGTAPSCAEGGVLGALPGVVGSMMAVEAVKIITGTGAALRGRMMIYDALYAETRIIETARRPDCAVCGTTAAK